MPELRQALQECLAFVNRFVPPFEVVKLQEQPVLPKDRAEWDDILYNTASHTILRSEALRTAAQFVTEGYGISPEADLFSGMHRFQQERRRLLASLSETDYHPELAWQDELARSQAFVIFEPFGTLSDGAAIVASAGYLDDYNCPPWDTWLMLLPALSKQDGPRLLCWVPEWAWDLVDSGVAVNPEECIYWADIQNLS